VLKSVRPYMRGNAPYLVRKGGEAFNLMELRHGVLSQFGHVEI